MPNGSPETSAVICSLLKRMRDVVCMRVGGVDAEVTVAAGSSTSASGQLEVHLLRDNRQQHGKKLVRFAHLWHSAVGLLRMLFCFSMCLSIYTQNAAFTFHLL